MNTNIAKSAFIWILTILLSCGLLYSMYSFRSKEIYRLSSPDLVMEDILASLKSFNPISIELNEATNDSKISKRKAKHIHQPVDYNFNLQTAAINNNDYEPIDDYIDYVVQKLHDNTLSYKKIADDNSGHQKYAIYANEDELFTVNLEGSFTGMRMGYTIYNWTPEHDNNQRVVLNAIDISGPINLNITVPEDFTVKINDQDLSPNSKINAEYVILPELNQLAKYSNIPSMATYSIEGMYLQPSVKIYHLDKEIDINETIEGNTISFSCDYEAFPIYDSLKDTVIDLVKNYPATEDIDQESFDNLELSNYTVYNKESFSCQIKGNNYDKEYYFVWDYIDDKYFIVDVK